MIDDDDGFLILHKGDLITTPSNKYRIIDYIGQGTFGQTFRCRNIQTGDYVAIKIIRSRDEFYRQGENEYRALHWMSRQTEENARHLTHLIDYACYHNHHMFVIPLYGFSLYRLIRSNCQGISLRAIRVVARSVGIVD